MFHCLEKKIIFHPTARITETLGKPEGALSNIKLLKFFQGNTNAGGNVVPFAAIKQHTVAKEPLSPETILRSCLVPFTTYTFLNLVHMSAPNGSQTARKRFANQMRSNVGGTANMHRAVAATECKQRAANRFWSVFPANTKGFYRAVWTEFCS